MAIYTSADGQVSRVVDGIKAVMDAHQLDEMKGMIRRGMAAVTRDGRHNDGAVYGYQRRSSHERSRQKRFGLIAASTYRGKKNAPENLSGA